MKPHLRETPSAVTEVAVDSSGYIVRSQANRSPVMIRFCEMTEDEVFVTASKAGEGVTFENTGTEPLVGLRYEGRPNAPQIGAVRG